MGLTHMLGCSIPPVGHDRTLRNRAEQFPFIDSEEHFRACKFKRNRSDMVMPGMFPSRNATGSKAIRNWALVRDIRLVKSGHEFNMERKRRLEEGHLRSKGNWFLRHFGVFSPGNGTLTLLG